MSFRSSVATALNKLAKLYLTIRQTPPIKTTDNITAVQDTFDTFDSTPNSKKKIVRKLDTKKEINPKNIDSIHDELVKSEVTNEKHLQ